MERTLSKKYVVPVLVLMQLTVIVVVWELFVSAEQIHINAMKIASLTLKIMAKHVAFDNRSLRAPFFMKQYKKLDKTMNV